MEENDDRSFEDHERILKEIKSLFFNTLYLWKAYFYFSFFFLFFLL
jgi:hypothetical protein